MRTHPGKEIAKRLEALEMTQKAFSQQIGKKVSEINELIKGKRNITIARDYLLAQVFNTPEKYWIHLQIDYEYEKMKLEKLSSIDTEALEQLKRHNEDGGLVDTGKGGNNALEIRMKKEGRKEGGGIEGIALDKNIQEQEIQHIKNSGRKELREQLRNDLTQIFFAF